MILNDFSLISSEPQYQQQQQQQSQPQQPQPQRPYRFRAPPTTAAPSFFQRLSNWFYFFGDDSGDKRPAPPPPPPRLPQQQNPSHSSQQLNSQLQLQTTNDQIRNGSRSSLLSNSYGAPNFGNQLNGGFQPIYQNNNFKGSGSSYLTVTNSYQTANNNNRNNYNSVSQGANQPYPSFIPPVLQQQSNAGLQHDPRILRPSQPVPKNSQFRDTEPTTLAPGIAPLPGGPTIFKDFNYHPCNNVPWVPVASPEGHFPGTQVPPNAIPQNPIPTEKPIKLEVKPKGQVQSVAAYPPAAIKHEPVIITADSHDQQLIQLQLHQQQQQLQTLQLQQLQIQQQQLQQQLHELKVSSTLAPPTIPTALPYVQSTASSTAHFVTRGPDPPATAVPITFRQVSASYFTNKEYSPPAKILPIQNEDKPYASIQLPNLSASPVPPLYTATSFHTDPYKYYRPGKTRDSVVELGYGYPQSLKSMSDSYTRYRKPDVYGDKINNSISDAEQIGSSSFAVYTTVPYISIDSKPAASEHRNITLTGSNQLVEEDSDYDSEEDDNITGVTVIAPVEVSNVTPNNKYLSYDTTTTTTTRAPSTIQSSPSSPPALPTDSGDLGHGAQLIYSANLQTSIPPIHRARQRVETHLSHLDQFNDLISEEEDPEARETISVIVSTYPPPTRPISSSATNQIFTNLSTSFQRHTTEVPITEVPTTTVFYTTETTPQPTTTARALSLTAAIGGHRNIVSTKKPKQIQIIIPYKTYKIPEPFKTQDLDENDHFPDESSIVTSTDGAITTISPSKAYFGTGESMKYFHSSSNIKDILRKESTRPFSRPSTVAPEKPTKTKKFEPVKVSNYSKPFTARIPKMTPMPPVFNLTGLSVTTPQPRTFRPAIVMAHPSKFAQHFTNVTRTRSSPTSHTYSPRTTLAQLLRTTKIITKSSKPNEEHEFITRPLPPVIFRRSTTTTTTTPETTTETTPPPPPTTTPSTTTTTTTTTPASTTTPTTTEHPEADPVPIYERSEWDIDPLLLQRRIDTWTEQQFTSDDYIRKTSFAPLHRVTKAIPWEFLTTTMLPSLRDRLKGRDSWRHLRIAISPHTREKVYVVTPQPWTLPIVHQETSASARFMVRPTPQYRWSDHTTAAPAVNVSPESGSVGSSSSNR